MSGLWLWPRPMATSTFVFHDTHALPHSPLVRVQVGRTPRQINALLREGRSGSIMDLAANAWRSLGCTVFSQDPRTSLAVQKKPQNAVRSKAWHHQCPHQFDIKALNIGILGGCLVGGSSARGVAKEVVCGRSVRGLMHSPVLGSIFPWLTCGTDHQLSSTDVNDAAVEDNVAAIRAPPSPCYRERCGVSGLRDQGFAVWAKGTRRSIELPDAPETGNRLARAVKTRYL